MEQKEGKPFPDEPIETQVLDTSMLTSGDQARIENMIKLGNISMGEATRRITERRKKINEIALNEDISPEEAEKRIISREEEQAKAE